jgi:hypothetical protein
MKTTKNINNQYANLCMKLGDQVLKKEQAEAAIAEIRAEIEVLNKALPVAEEAERQAEKEAQEERAAQEARRKKDEQQEEFNDDIPF